MALHKYVLTESQVHELLGLPPDVRVVGMDIAADSSPVPADLPGFPGATRHPARLHVVLEGDDEVVARHHEELLNGSC